MGELVGVSRQEFLSYQEKLEKLMQTRPPLARVLGHLECQARQGVFPATEDLVTLYEGRVAYIWGDEPLRLTRTYPEKAFQWAECARRIRPESPLAAVRLGRMHCQGYGTAKDHGIGLPLMIEGVRLAADGLSRGQLSKDYLLFMDSWCNQIKGFMAEVSPPTPQSQPTVVLAGQVLGTVKVHPGQS